MYEEELKIPKDRVAVLIGKKGETKRAIQSRTKTKIRVSKEGDVEYSRTFNRNTGKSMENARTVN